jgi:hypothetical protein
MLHTEAVGENALALTKQLQSDPLLKGFILVGGTALALQIRHRTSVDLDFFTQDEFNHEELLEHLEHHYHFNEQYRHQNTLKGIINGVAVDFLRHDYKLIEEPLQIQGIKMASKPDIAAMKVNAIAGNGTRVKDFIDIYFLLKEFDFKEIINFYLTKYNTRNDFHAIKSLTYFDDVILEEWPEMISEKDLEFQSLKKNILDKRDIFLKGRIIEDR